MHDQYGTYGEKLLYGKTVHGVIRATFVLDENGVITMPLYNIEATGHVAMLRKKLELDGLGSVLATRGRLDHRLGEEQHERRRSRRRRAASPRPRRGREGSLHRTDPDRELQHLPDDGGAADPGLSAQGSDDDRAEPGRRDDGEHGQRDRRRGWIPVRR